MVDATVTGSADASFGSPDAPFGSPDAPFGSPDATVGSPDAPIGSPDATVPDATVPDATVPDGPLPIDATPPADAPPGTTCTLQTPSFSQSTSVSILDLQTVTSTINVTGVNPYLWDVRVTTNITHSYSGDLGIVLISPAGTRIEMSRRLGGSAADIWNGTVWDDAAPIPAVDYSFASGITATPVVPEGAFGQLSGDNPNGVWTLEVTDNAGFDTGSINSWSLAFTASVAPTTTTSSFASAGAVAIPDVSTATSNVVVSGAGTQICDINLTTNITHTYSGDLDLVLISPSGTRTVLVTDNGAGTAQDVFNGSLWDDETGIFIADYSFSDGVVATPLLAEGAMGAFAAENPNGTWTLEVTDTASLDTGTIDAWSLSITTCDCP